MTAREAFDFVTSGGGSDFAEAVGLLDRGGPWCLIGGLAVNCYVEPVYTIDADVVVAAENLIAIQRDFANAGFELEEFPNSLNARKSGSKLVLQFTRDERYAAFPARAERREVLGCNVPVALLEDVVAGKLWAWRDAQRRPTKRKKDELDLMRIAEAYPHLRSSLPQEIVEQIEKRK